MVPREGNHTIGKALANVTVDRESISAHSTSEWKLNPGVFRTIEKRLGPCTTDLFATRLNTQLDRYVSWRPDPFATSTDALPWRGTQGYAFHTVCTGREVPEQDQEGAGNNPPDSICVSHTDVVSVASGVTGRNPNSPPSLLRTHSGTTTHFWRTTA